MDKIDYVALKDHAEKLKHKGFEMALDPRMKMENISMVYHALEVAEMMEEEVENHEKDGQNEIKDELQAAEAKFKLYQQTKNVAWLKAADVETDHAALYMAHYNDYEMKDWHDSLKAKINKAVIAPA